MNLPAASYVEQLASAFSQAQDGVCNQLAGSLDAARERKANVFLCGNGGSAANANHWANDLIYGAGKTGRGGVRAHSLAANTSVIMCLANDTGYENVFSLRISKWSSVTKSLKSLPHLSNEFSKNPRFR